MPEFTIGNYLATRLEQIGIRHYFMVPGDYNLVLLDQLLANKNMEQIGCCNELNASYAAEAYARVNGCGAVVATMNVGSFSALNGVAGAYAERLPVIFVSSGYNTNDASTSHLLHHSLGTHDFSYQFNGAFTRLPGGARFEIEMQWGSLGWACPATFGYAMGLEADRRLVSVIGDGSFQLTAQEVANMIRHGQETVIFLVNNRGYVSESAIHDGPYNYFKNWDYAGLIDAWNADDGNGLGLTAATGGELADAISKARKHKGGPVLIECQTAHDDCSPQLIEWGARVARANIRPHQTT